MVKCLKTLVGVFHYEIWKSEQAVRQLIIPDFDGSSQVWFAVGLMTISRWTTTYDYRRIAMHDL